MERGRVMRSCCCRCWERDRFAGRDACRIGGLWPVIERAS